ncbi:MAG TPA: GNAT family N-acetyltransferase [Ramlibacter sp.]|nr:GNAT family N-acetyltransferase [Ramlibacter sp.]
MIKIRAASWPRDLPVVQELFREYVESLGVDLSFQDFDAEVSGLPGRYARPGGEVLLAWEGGHAVGCVARRALDAERCEMKRLYVRPAGRGTRLGRRLAQEICEDARAAGFRRIYLDTLPAMTAAQGLYRSLGFLPTEAYTFNPITGTQYFRLDLRPALS